MITAAAIVKIAPAARPYADELAAQMAESGIMENRRRASIFLGQIAVESAGFTAIMENLSYSEKRIRELAQQSREGSRWRSLGPRAAELARNRDFSRAWLGDDSLLSNPDRVADPDGAVASAIWFWLANGLNEIADRGDVRAVTIKVNGGTFGLRDREIWTDKFSNAWADFSNVISGANTVRHA
jgi:predicted chitinase